MSDMDFLERQALERTSFIGKHTYNPNEKSKSEKIKPKVTSMPVELPEGYSYPNFKTVFKEEKEKQSALKSNNLNELLSDPETALLTGLIMLLKSEGADETLLAALGYILL